MLTGCHCSHRNLCRFGRRLIDRADRWWAAAIMVAVAVVVVVGMGSAEGQEGNRIVGWGVPRRGC